MPIYVTRAEALRALAEFAEGVPVADALDEAVEAGWVRRLSAGAVGSLYCLDDLAVVRRSLPGWTEAAESDQDVPPGDS